MTWAERSYHLHPNADKGFVQGGLEYLCHVLNNILVITHLPNFKKRGELQGGGGLIVKWNKGKREKGKAGDLQLALFACLLFVFVF